MKNEGKTLTELGVKMGDVVYYDEPRHGGRGDDRTIREGDVWMDGPLSNLSDRPYWHIVSRAEPTEETPKTWGEMTPEEKGALLLAHHEGAEIGLERSDGSWKSIEGPPSWESVVPYRVKPEPVRETEKFDIFVARGFGAEVVGTDGWKPTHTVKIETIEGKPITGTYTNEAGDVVAIEEITNE